MSWLKQLFNPRPIPYPASDSAPDLAATLIEAEQMAGERVDYLLGNRLFRQIVVETPLGTRRPKMTLGGLWERIEQLDEADLGAGDRERLRAVRERWEDARRRYPEHFDQKLKRELDSYLKNWQYFLKQRASSPERWQSEDEVELRNRQRVNTVLRLLGPAAPAGLMDDLKKLESEANLNAD